VLLKDRPGFRVQKVVRQPLPECNKISHATECLTRCAGHRLLAMTQRANDGVEAEIEKDKQPLPA
jgi:hypothetical protein